MSGDRGFPAPRAGRFATTRWSLVLAAGRSTDTRSAEALAHLCDLYWYPVYAFIRRQGNGPEDSADLTQEFFARVLEKNYFHDADPARGHFRGFLCASVRHFLSNQRDRAQALRRGGRQPLISLDAELAEGQYRLEPRDNLTPERLLDRRWALILLDRVLSRLRADHVAAGKADLFDRLKGFLTGDNAELRYADVAKATGGTEGAIKVAVHRLRRQYRDILIQEIAETVSDPAEITAEIEHLLKAVSL